MWTNFKKYDNFTDHYIENLTQKGRSRTLRPLWNLYLIPRYFRCNTGKCLRHLISNKKLKHQYSERKHLQNTVCITVPRWFCQHHIKKLSLPRIQRKQESIHTHCRSVSEKCELEGTICSKTSSSISGSVSLWSLWRLGAPQPRHGAGSSGIEPGGTCLTSSHKISRISL